MSMGNYLGLRFLVLFLSFYGPLLSPTQAQSSTSNPSHLSDEETVRTLTTAYGLGIADGEIETMRQLWNPTSFNLASRLWAYQGLFSYARIEFFSMQAPRLAVTVDKAVSHLTTDK